MRAPFSGFNSPKRRLFCGHCQNQGAASCLRFSARNVTITHYHLQPSIVITSTVVVRDNIIWFLILFFPIDNHTTMRFYNPYNLLRFCEVILEYFAVVWDTHTTCSKDQIE